MRWGVESLFGVAPFEVASAAQMDAATARAGVCCSYFAHCTTTCGDMQKLVVVGVWLPRGILTVIDTHCLDALASGRFKAAASHAVSLATRTTYVGLHISFVYLGRLGCTCDNLNDLQR